MIGIITAKHHDKTQPVIRQIGLQIGCRLILIIDGNGVGVKKLEGRG